MGEIEISCMDSEILRKKGSDFDLFYLSITYIIFKIYCDYYYCPLALNLGDLLWNTW